MIESAQVGTSRPASAAARLGYATSAKAESTDHGWTAVDFWAFVVPAVAFLEIALVGRLKLSEVLAVVLLPWLLGKEDRLRVPRWFIVVWVGWFASQVVTDIVVGSALVDYSRGWAKILVTLTSFVAILALVSTPRRARLFALGLACSGVAGYFLLPSLAAASDPWKWALAFPIGLFAAAALSGATGLRRRWLPVIVFAAFGVANLLLGYRSLGGVALMTSAYLLLNGLVGRERLVLRPSIGRAVLGVVSCVVIAGAVLLAYDSAAAGGLLGADAQSKYLTQSGSLGVLLGGRSESLVSTQAILRSPVLGHGSWARDPKYVELLSDRLVSLGYEDISRDPADIGVIPAHSYLLGAWVEGGILGGLFWLSIAVMAGWLLLNLYPVRWTLMPLVVFAALLLLWDIAFSPYGEAGRLAAPYEIALCLLAFRYLRASATAREPTKDRHEGFHRRRSRSTKRGSYLVRWRQCCRRTTPTSSTSSWTPDPQTESGDHRRTSGTLARVVLESDAGPADGLDHGFEFATGEGLGVRQRGRCAPPWRGGRGRRLSGSTSLGRRRLWRRLHGRCQRVCPRTIESSPFNLRRYAYGSVMVLQQATFIRRLAFDRTDGFNVANRACWDGELLADIAVAGGRLEHVPRMWGAFAIYPDTITGSQRFS